MRGAVGPCPGIPDPGARPPRPESGPGQAPSGKKKITAADATSPRGEMQRTSSRLAYSRSPGRVADGRHLASKALVKVARAHEPPRAYQPTVASGDPRRDAAGHAAPRIFITLLTRFFIGPLCSGDIY